MNHGVSNNKMMVTRVSDDALLADVLRVAQERGNSHAHTYRAHGAYSLSSVTIRFGTWRQALRRAGITLPRSADRAERDEADFVPLFQPKARKCLQCGVAILSVNYTCGNCFVSNSCLVLADGWEQVG